MKQLTTAITAALFLGACASVPYTEKVLSDGGTLVKGDFGSLVGESGTTAVGVEGKWQAFYGKDGRKVVRIIHSNEISEMTWRVNDLGHFCEVQMSSRKEHCYGDDYQMVKTKDGVYSRVENGKKGKYPFRIEEGNTKNL